MSATTAKEARRLAESFDTRNQLRSVLTGIHKSATNGEYEFHVYHSLTGMAIRELESRGFKIIKAPPVSNQKDELYYTITWKEEFEKDERGFGQ